MKELNKQNLVGLTDRGVYKIYFYKNNIPYPIPRITKTDTSGLIYIGCTKKQNFEVRLNNFLLSSTKLKTNNHSGGDKISKSNVLKNLFSDGILMFVVLVHSSPLDEEKTLIESYVKEFGEKPPLNG
jgi:hypothetical protein